MNVINLLFRIVLTTLIITLTLLASCIWYIYNLDTSNVVFDDIPYKDFNVRFPKPGQKLKVAFTVAGTRGDIQPMALIAQQFKKDGHSVVLTIRERYKNLVLNTFGFKDNEIVWMPEELETEVRLGDPIRRSNFVVQTYNFLKYSVELLEKYLVAFEDSRFDDIDLVVYADISATFGSLLGIRHKAPQMLIKFVPWVGTFTELSQIKDCKSEFLNWFSFSPFIFGKIYFEHSIYHQYQEKYGVDPIPLSSMYFGKLKHQIPTYNAFSTILYPKLSKPPPWYRYVGPLIPKNPEKEYEGIEKGLSEFINAGKDKVQIYVGFGSFSIQEYFGNDSNSIINIFYNTFRGMNAHVVFLNSTFGASPNSEAGRNPNWFFAKELPHAWVFKHVDLIIYHGGAGTVQTAALSGKPSLCIPMFDEQTINANTIADIGLGIVLQNWNLSETSLERSITEALSLPNVQKKSETLQKDMWEARDIYKDMLHWIKYK